MGLNIDNSAEPKPNGSEDFFEMKTMDFEEYLWARGYGDETIQGILEYFEKRTPVPEIIHNQMKKLFNEYICVGGYPEAILNFFQTNNYYEAFKKTRSLVIDIKGDASKRLSEDKKPLYAPGEVARIQKSFELIASFIVEDNKRYVMSKIGGNSYQRDDAINYLLNACVAFKANNVEVPSLPLGVKKISSDFKLFYADIGILINELGFDVVQSIQNDDEMGMNKGYLYEAVVADSLYKANIPLYYYAKSGKFEIDLVISYRGHSTLVEAKAKSGNTKSSKTVLKNPGLYGETKLIKIGNYNVGEEGDVLTIPHYLAFALGKHNNEEVTQ